LIVYLPNIQEWDDYRENKKDYSGLKIESLKIEEPQEEEEEETEINEVPYPTPVSTTNPF
jgi:hypothetical protein